MNVSRTAATKHRAAALLITGVTCTGGLLASPGVAAAEGISDAEKSIVLIGVEWEGYVQYPDSEGGLSWSDVVTVSATCTGWFASEEGHIVTAGHCVDPGEGKTALLHQFLADNDALDREAEARANWRVEGLEQGSEPARVVQVVQPEAVEGAVITTPLTVQVADYQPFEDGDVALLQANGLTEKTPGLSIADEPADIGDSVTAIGFPGAVADVSDVARLRASFKSGTVSSSQVSPNGVAGTEVNADISGGMSGGPTLDESGAVLGVNSYTISGESRNFNFITDGRALRSYLQRLDVPVVAPAPEPAAPTATEKKAAPVERADEGGIPVWAYAAGGAGLLVLVTLGVVLLRRRPSSAPAAGPAPVPGPVGPVFGPVPAGGMVPPAREPMDPPLQAAGAPASGPVCGHEGNAPGARFCQSCGQPLAQSPA